MRTIKLTAIILTIAVLGLMPVLPTAAASSEQPNVTITLLNEPPSSLAIGESYTADILVESDMPFTMAIAQPDVQFPAYLQDNGDVTGSNTSAVLHVTFTGRRDTSGLPGGATPAAAVAGVRFQGGQVVSQSFDFSVAVHP
jgi:hypothetical protein